MKNESNQQKPPINEIYFFFKMKLMGIVRMHLAEIELRCKQIYAKLNSMERMFFFSFGEANISKGNSHTTSIFKIDFLL